MKNSVTSNQNFYSEIKTLLQNARNSVYQTINTTMTKAYYEIGRRGARRRGESYLWQISQRSLPKSSAKDFLKII